MNEAHPESPFDTLPSVDLVAESVRLVRVVNHGQAARVGMKGCFLRAITVGNPMMFSFEDERGKVIQTSKVKTIRPLAEGGYEVGTESGSVYRIEAVNGPTQSGEGLPSDRGVAARIAQTLDPDKKAD